MNQTCERVPGRRAIELTLVTTRVAKKTRAGQKIRGESAVPLGEDRARSA